MTYNIRETIQGEEIQSMPQEGAWYCHFEVLPNGDIRDGQIAQCQIESYVTFDADGKEVAGSHIYWYDDDGQSVEMFSDDHPDFLVKQG